MPDYRCYFFGPTAESRWTRVSIDAAEDLSATSDDEACAAAELSYRRRRNQMHGFEVWQGVRLVFRHSGNS